MFLFLGVWVFLFFVNGQYVNSFCGYMAYSIVEHIYDIQRHSVSENIDLVSYRKSQIKKLNRENETFTQVNKIKKEKTNKKRIKNLQVNIKTQVAKRIEKKKTEIRKVQELYSNPQSIPDEIKTKVALTIEEKKVELKNMYSKPKDIFTLERVGRWSVIQVVKLFFGMPIMPGR